MLILSKSVSLSRSSSAFFIIDEEILLSTIFLFKFFSSILIFCSLFSFFSFSLLVLISLSIFSVLVFLGGFDSLLITLSLEFCSLFSWLLIGISFFFFLLLIAFDNRSDLLLTIISFPCVNKTFNCFLIFLFPKKQKTKKQIIWIIRTKMQIPPPKLCTISLKLRNCL